MEMDLMLIDLLESSKAIGLCPMGRYRTLFWGMRRCTPEPAYSAAETNQNFGNLYVKSATII